MAKDSYWFKHDSSAGRGLRMRKMAHIHGHWGKGIYWDVIEVLREQEDYIFELSESSLQMLSDLIGCKDSLKFINWFNDCLKIGLFSVTDSVFFECVVLTENMKNWETKKVNGSKGGRPKKTEIKPNEKLIETIREEKRREEERREDDVFTDIEDLKIEYLKNKRLIGAVCKDGSNNVLENDIESRLIEFNHHLESKSRFQETWKEYSGYFLNWVRKQPKKTNGLKVGDVDPKNGKIVGMILDDGKIAYKPQQPTLEEIKKAK